jgi:hypothetical protein
MKAISSFEVLPDGKILVKTPYCEEVVACCRSWGGKFDKQAGGWVVAGTRLSELEKLIGAAQSDLVEVEVGSADWRGYAQISVGWHVLAARRGRDYGADLYADMVAGSLPSSGGSVKNPRVAASDDARFRLWVPRDFAALLDLQVVTDPACDVPPAGINPLAEFSDEEVLAEVRRRGLV